jgi:tetratricopeptide (TPR) repeat protein/predicted Ser/Thr protein kinase
MAVPSKQDLAVAKLCIERGYATREQVQECLRESGSEGHASRPLEAALRQRGYISEDVYCLISSSYGRTVVPSSAGPGAVLQCPSCGTAYTGDLCPRCVAGFAQFRTDPQATKLDSRTRQVDPPAVPAERAPETLDPEVEQAAGDPKKRFGKYVLVRELGAGGMGVVFKAWQTDLRRYVAIKFIRGVESRADLERFRREAQTAATLSHPGIAPIFESGEQDGKHYFAMQFVDGRTFDELFSSKPRPALRTLVQILVKVSEAVEYAHEHEIIHRDLKPQNVMLDGRERVYVMDFGLAKSVRSGSSLTGSGVAVGTPSYMSPEQAQGEQARIGPRSDVYALGAILYHVATGRPPFGGKDPLETLRKVVDDEPIPPRKINPKVHPDLETIALKALEKDPARRYGSASEFAQELGRWLEGEPILARPTGALSRIVRRVWKHKILSGGVLALAAGLGIGSWALLERLATVRETREAKAVRAGALPYYQEALSAFQETDAIRRNSASKLLGQYRPLLARAEANAQEAIRRDPAYADAYFLLGQVLDREMLGNKDPVPEFSKVVELEPTNIRAYLERARTRLRAIFTEYGLSTINVRTGTLALHFVFHAPDARLEAERRLALADLERAQRLSPKPLEKALLEGSALMASWRPGSSVDLGRAQARLREAAELASNDPEPLLLLAQCRMLSRDLEGAAANIVEAIQLAPNDFGLLYEATRLLSYANRPKDALPYARRALEIWPRNYRAHVQLGNLLGESGEDRGAVEAFRNAIELEPHQAEAYVSLGGHHLYQYRYAEALAAYEEGLKVNSDRVELLEGKVAALSQLHRDQEALPVMDVVVHARPDAESYSNRAALRSRLGRSKEAEEDLDRASTLEPDNPNVLFTAACHHLREDRYGRALELLERCRKLGREDRDVLFAFGDALFNLDRNEEALPYFEKALRAGREQPDTYARLARTHLRLKHYEEALKFFETAIKLGQSDAPVFRGIGETLFLLERYAEALPHFQEAARKEPDYPEGRWGLADTLSKLGRWAEAEPEYSRGLEKKADSPPAWSGRGLCRCQLGRLDEGLEDYLRALKLKPDDSGFLREIGLIHFVKKNFPEALAYVERSIAAGRHDADILSLYGETLRSLDRFEQATEAFNRAIALKENDPVLYFYRARSKYSSGKKAEGREDLEAALRINPDFAPAIGQRGIISVWEKKYKDAIPDLERALKLQPSLGPTIRPYLDRARQEAK